MKLKFIPNALSIGRIVLCIPLAIIPFVVQTPFTWFYILLFAFAAVTDTFDGQLARRIKDAKSELGATLDSVADICLVAVIVFSIMPKMEVWSWIWPSYICLLTFKIIASTSIGFIRFKEFVSLHTLSFKLLIIVLFFYPILYFFIGAGLFINVLSTIIGICALFIVIEEILIISMTKRPERNLKSVFGVKAANRAAEAELSAKTAE